MIAQTPPTSRSAESGFTLVELTVVLVIVALLSSGLMLGLSGQRDQIQNKEAQQQLEIVRDALLGFAMANGRLPCPADPTLGAGGGGEDIQLCAAARGHAAPYTCIATDQQCAREHGVLPWRTLGIQETDVWSNRFTYFVGYEFADPLIKGEVDAGRRSRFTLDTNGRANIQDSAGNNLAAAIPAVIVSHGPRGAGAYLSTGTQIPGAAGDEAENVDTDLIFIAHTPTENFDDLVTWIIPTVLKSRMVSVGKLP
ncbi:MAG: hypothetical protein H6R14_1065 [Proteobacteria bacterium]|nr:hypothetical protein [Pseudomonadota bacterium]